MMLAEGDWITRLKRAAWARHRGTTDEAEAEVRAEVTHLRAERDEARAKQKLCEDFNIRIIADNRRREEALEAERDTLKAALLYARHYDSCPQSARWDTCSSKVIESLGPCDCGLDALRAALAPPTGDPQ